MELTSLQNGRYKIESILGQGGFGITYRAVQTSLGRTVAIKEFFMKDYCERAEGSTHVTMGTQSSREMVQRYRDKFEKEARTLARLKHPHIIPVIDVFQENNTSYYVMEYAEGASLKQQVDEKGPLSEARAVNYILQVADALRYLHGQHICHLDIKPANILTTAHGEAILADFGLAKQYDEEGGETSTTPVGKSKGYAPPEQYRTGGVQSFSPETDVYALGATFYFLLTGKTPPESVLLNEQSLDVSMLSPNMAQAVQAVMQLRRADRVTLGVFEELLNKESERPKPIKDEELTIVDVEPTPITPQTKKHSSVWSKYPKIVKFIVILTIITNPFIILLSFDVDNTHIIEVLPLFINLISSLLLYKGEKSGFGGILFAPCLSILYWIKFPPYRFHNDNVVLILTYLLPITLILCLSFMCKYKGKNAFSLLYQSAKIRAVVIGLTIFITILSFSVPYYYANKLGINSFCINEWVEIIDDIKYAKNNSKQAYSIYQDYIEDQDAYHDYFYKDEEKAAYWLNKYNELKAQRK